MSRGKRFSSPLVGSPRPVEQEALAIDSTPRVPIAIFERPDPDGGVRRFSGGRPQLSQRFGELGGEEVEETLGIRPGIDQREVVVAGVHELLGDGEVGGGFWPHPEHPA